LNWPQIQDYFATFPNPVSIPKSQDLGKNSNEWTNGQTGH